MRKFFSFPLIALLFAISAYLLQLQMFLNGDVGSLLYDTRLFLQGGSYLHDFLETNPPMIFVIYSPVVLFAKWSSINIVILIRLYIIFFALVSTGLSNVLLKKIIKPADDLLRHTILLGLLFAFLFLPGCEFGQREHFFSMLIMPYIFSAVLAVQSQKINKKLAILIAIMAALGIGMKPYFLAPFMLVELYLIVIRRNILSPFRLESCVIMFSLVSYLSWVWLSYPTYFHQMLPLISDLYFISIKDSWTFYFSNLSSSYCVFIMVLLFLSFKTIKKYQMLTGVLLWAFVGMILAAIIPRAGWYYHILPAIILSILLLLLYVLIIFSANEKFILKKEVYCALFIAMMVPFYICMISINYAIAVKKHSYLNALIADIQKQKNPPSIYCFSANTTGDCFTLVYFTNSRYAGKYPFFWWMKGLQMMEKKGTLSLRIQKDKKFLIDAVADDLNKSQPDWLIINTFDAAHALRSDFNFINYFSQNEKFRQAWTHYHYAKKVGVFAVYQRS